MYGVDTPEVSDQYHGFKPTTGIEGEFGAEATEATRKLIFHKHIVERVITIDRYKRTVAAISVDGIDLATYLVEKGLARVAYMSLIKSSPYYTRDLAYYKSLLLKQHIAFMHHVGFWARLDKIKEIFPKA